jgi:acyl dehydratase
MAIDYGHIMSLKGGPLAMRYEERQSILYALGVGFGSADSLDREELRFVYEKNLKTAPTLATVIAWDLSILQDAGLNPVMIVHGEQRLTLHRPLPPAADIIGNSRIVGCFDKGADKGAIVLTETEITLANGEPLCTLGATIFARGDGGFGGPQGSGPAPHELPNRGPDVVCELATRTDQALIYRLSGDRNPLHADPDFASAAGFPKPILHGLATYGIVCRAVLKTICGYDHTRIKSFDVRFSSPVFPGETIVTEMWQDGNVVSFRARPKEREVLVINNGRCEIAS